MDDPIFYNSTKAKLSSLVFASIVYNFSMIISKASITDEAFSYLPLNSSLSLTLDSYNSVSLLSKISNYLALFAISFSNIVISPVKIVISDSASSLYLVATEILLSYSSISSSHSNSYALWS